jgi:hypothetical protein
MSRLLAAVLGTALFTGCSAKASSFKTVTLCDFERTADPVAESPHYDIPTALKKPNYTNHDFRWNTSGYASMEPVSKDEAKAAKNKPFYKFFQGKTAARVRFTVPSDYKKSGETQSASWETGLSLATDSYTQLPVTDWSPYHYLAFSVYNPGTQDQKLFVRFSDASSHVTLTAAVAPAGQPSILEFDLTQLSDARLDTKDMRSFTLYLDTAGQSKDPVLVLDNVQLHTGTVEERRKEAMEEGEGEDQSDDEDWDSEEEDPSKVAPPIVSRPSGITGLPAAAGAGK